MKRDTGIDIPLLKVDGGAAMNNYLMQFQADILGIEIERAANLETTSLGAAYMAGLGIGYWQDIDELKSLAKEGANYQPMMSATRKANLYRGWQQAVKATQIFAEVNCDEAADHA